MEKTSMESKLQHWKTHLDENQIAWWYFDKAGSSVNTFDYTVLSELESLIDHAHSDTTIKGIIITSKKSTGFIAGADIQQFSEIKSLDEAFKIAHTGQSVLNKLAQLKQPTVALINGYCMGGGTELSLACRYRIAKDDAKTRIGLPEVKLGIQPGWGGTIRLPLLIGPLKAMNIILTGNPISVKEALRSGLIDCAVPERHLETAAKYFILSTPPKHHPSFIERLPNMKIFRGLFAKILRKKVSARVKKEHYPAPFAIIDYWEKDGCTAPKAMENEAHSIASLIISETAQNLVRVFFLQNQLKNVGKGSDINIKHVHVVGAGVMGGDIAAWCALSGFTVTLQDKEPKYIAPAMKRAFDLFKNKLKEERAIQETFDRLLPDIEGHGISKADIIIEAIIEQAKAKQDLFKLLEEKAKPDTILATNTSGIPLSQIAEVMKNPERIVGLHFFNPVSKMPLVEIVYDVNTDPNIPLKAANFARQIDKLPLIVKSAPGFLVNRVLMPYMLEALIILNEGTPAELIDKAAVSFGMPMGPVELADTVGLDVCLSVAKYLISDKDKTTVYAAMIADLENKIAQHHLGRKSGEGFYVYKNNKPFKKPLKKSSQDSSNSDITEITHRLIYRMLNESIACLREEIVENKDLLDAGMIFGTGFAPFLGGPLHYAEKVGASTIVSTLKHLQQRYGDRFMPDKAWSE
jgi:3-hydroxyacyl-CoA dehydrogenase/enoyl-CoA hydratase/3-hydroxybutyryl-CoA epimerase